MTYRRLLFSNVVGVTKSVTIVRYNRLTEPLSSFSEVPIANDMIAVKDAARFVAG